MSDSDEYRRLRSELEDVLKFVKKLATSPAGTLDIYQLRNEARRNQRRLDDALTYARRLEEERDDQERKYRRARRDSD